jgi:glycosyltransferase involved in cell wall biosynthesis
LIGEIEVDMKITIVGPYPPLFGGISVHVKRVKMFLEKKDIEVFVYNESKIGKDSDTIKKINNYRSLMLRILFNKSDIIHFHAINKYVRALLGFYKIFGKKIVLTIHGESLNIQLSESNRFIRKLLILSLRQLDAIICVNPLHKEQLINYGIDSRKLNVIPAYIDPIEDEKDFENIPQKVWDFIEGSNFLISANGWIRKHNGEDLYGLDMLIELVNLLRRENYNVSLLFVLIGKDQQSVEERMYYEKIKSKIKKSDLEDFFYIFESKHTEFYPLLRQSDLFIRPTNTDGFGVSIAEALFFNIPSIASDVCERPGGTILFQSRNSDDLKNKTCKVINEIDRSIIKLNSKENKNEERILSLYSSILRGKVK